jgi:hypothetical protein
MLPVLAVMAQNVDTVNKKVLTEKRLQEKRDSVAANPIVPKIKPKTWHPDSNHSPHTAVMHSLIVPGWGQVYNHQTWLVPAIYIGLAIPVYYYFVNANEYHGYLAVAQFLERGTTPAPSNKYYNLYQSVLGVQPTLVNDVVAGSKRNMELCVFTFAGIWGIQIIQAYIEAKFQHSYTMDNILTMKVSPTFINPPMYASNLNGSYIPGLKLTFTLK